VTAFSAKSISDMGALRMASIGDLAPNFNFSDMSSIRNTKIIVRGISSDANSIGVDQSSGMYVDGVYMGRPTTINLGLYDLERVEVLRGPQGTLYGRNTIGGAINMMTKKPGKELSGDFSAQYGNYNKFLMYGAVNLPVNERLSVRVAAQANKRDGFLKNLAGPDNNDDNNLNARIAVRYQASEAVEVLLRADWSRDRTHQGGAEIFIHSPMFTLPRFNVVPGTRYYIPDGRYSGVIAEYPGSYQDRDVAGGSLEINWDTGAAGTLTSLTAYRGFKWANAQTTDKSPFNIFGTGIKEDQRQFSQELRLTSPSGQRFEYVAGLYYWHMKLDAIAGAFEGPDLLSVSAFGGAPLGSFPGSEGDLYPKIRDDSFAAFVHGIYHVGDDLDVIAGARYTYEKKDINFSNRPDLLGLIGAINPAVKTDSMTDNTFTPMASLEYRFMPNWNVYATYSQGFKAGGYNAFSFTFANADGSIPDFKPEKAYNYEAGLRFVSPDHKLRASLSGFYLDYKNLQVNQRLEDEHGLFFFRTSNAATARSKGFEVELYYKVLPSLSVAGTFGYADAKYKDFIQDAVNHIDYSGNRLPYSAKGNWSLSFDYNHPVANDLNFVMRGELVHRGSTFSEDSNRLLTLNEAYSLVNGRVGLADEKRGISVVAWARNLLDEKYTRDTFSGSGAFSPGALGAFVGEPRTYGLEVNFHF
jgi:iron complex outermembrane receptor protein